MNWNFVIKLFKSYLITEKGLSINSVEAYLHDVLLLKSQFPDSLPVNIKTDDIENFLAVLYDLGMSSSSQARILSGLKSFYNYLILEKSLQNLLWI